MTNITCKTLYVTGKIVQNLPFKFCVPAVLNEKLKAAISANSKFFLD